MHITIYNVQDAAFGAELLDPPGDLRYDRLHFPAVYIYGGYQYPSTYTYTYIYIYRYTSIAIRTGLLGRIGVVYAH